MLELKSIKLKTAIFFNYFTVKTINMSANIGAQCLWHQKEAFNDK